MGLVCKIIVIKKSAYDGYFMKTVLSLIILADTGDHFDQGAILAAFLIQPV